jgi:hypothetical protein
VGRGQDLMTVKKTDFFEKKILQNIERDRDIADQFLNKITDYIETTPVEELNGEYFSKVMLAAAKLVENSQKSNEQLLRIFEAYYKKKDPEGGVDLSKDDIERLYREEVEI